MPDKNIGAFEPLPDYCIFILDKEKKKAGEKQKTQQCQEVRKGEK